MRLYFLQLELENDPLIPIKPSLEALFNQNNVCIKFFQYPLNAFGIEYKKKLKLNFPDDAGIFLITVSFFYENLIYANF